MRIAVIGLPSSGKTTVFQALTGVSVGMGERGSTVASVSVPDARVDRLSEIYKPKKTTYTTVEYVDQGGIKRSKTGEASELGAAFLTAVRPAAALVHVIDAFSLPEEADAFVTEAVEALDTELVFSDLNVCEKRLARLKKEGAKSGPAVEEARVLEAALEVLGDGKPLRINPELANAPVLRHFTLLSSKKVITVVNTGEGADWTPDNLPENVRHAREGEWGSMVALCAQVEAELASLPADEAAAFLADFGIDRPARERVLQVSYALLGLTSFYTAGEDEVRAWPIPVGAVAQEAAGVIHTDIARGFIRAEIVDFDTLVDLGSFDEAKKRGKMRLEGKTYVMQEGDVVNFRFNV